MAIKTHKVFKKPQKRRFGLTFIEVVEDAAFFMPNVIGTRGSLISSSIAMSTTLIMMKNGL